MVSNEGMTKYRITDLLSARTNSNTTILTADTNDDSEPHPAKRHPTDSADASGTLSRFPF